MKINLCHKLFYIIFILFISGWLFSANVVKITGYKKRSSRNKEQNQEIPSVKIETSGQINQALKNVKSSDIKYYRFLKKMRNKDFDRFLDSLNKWFKDNNTLKNRREKKQLLGEQKKLRLKLKKLAQGFKREEDEEKKKDRARKIKIKISKLVKSEILYDKLLIKLQKQHIALMETKLEKKSNEKSFNIKQYLFQFLGSDQQKIIDAIT